MWPSIRRNVISRAQRGLVLLRPLGHVGGGEEDMGTVL